MAWRIGVAVVALAALAFSVFAFGDGASSLRAAAQGSRAIFLMLAISGTCIAGAVHAWKTAPRIVVHEDALELGEHVCRVHGIELDCKKGVRDEYERYPPFDVLLIHAIDEGGTPRTMKLTSREWPDIGAAESAVRELVQRAVSRGYR
jgi:hypothetical protein